MSKKNYQEEKGTRKTYLDVLEDVEMRMRCESYNQMKRTAAESYRRGCKVKGDEHNVSNINNKHNIQVGTPETCNVFNLSLIHI